MTTSNCFALALTLSGGAFEGAGILLVFRALRSPPPKPLQPVAREEIAMPITPVGGYRSDQLEERISALERRAAMETEARQAAPDDLEGRVKRRLTALMQRDIKSAADQIQERLTAETAKAKEGAILVGIGLLLQTASNVVSLVGS
jgi:hypothetical protein